MATKLVIVESPAKAKTIRGYLGSDYEVEASIGHIRDLHPNAKSLPEELRKKWWADYSVDIDQDFEPIYTVSPEKADQVKKLRAAMKGKDTLVLATDEDREGESISWHLLQVLKPAKNVQVKRIAFHEITKDAILKAIQNPREIDRGLVEAQEARRILDRLYGYTLSPVLWSRLAKNLSAGRVQSPAVKLIVDREELRRKFRAGAYWDLRASLEADQKGFTADLKQIDGVRVATGNDFDDATGGLRSEREGKVLLLDRATATALAEKARTARPWTVADVEAKEATEKPAPPFMTTTLQQDANRKFGFSADRTMRIAQTLYEGVDMGGDRVGLITYMRTDSLSLSGEALHGLRSMIQADYADCLPDKPNHYASRVRNAQEAHEAIRPTDAFRKPSDLATYLNADQLKIYDLIWKRTVASQMLPARVLKTVVQIDVQAESQKLRFEATGKQILFDGFRRIYLEGRDEEDEQPGERQLPKMLTGRELEVQGVDPLGHETKPPARYTDATLIRELEKQGIGRPSTYASILSVIVDRGYVRKGGKQLIPTFKAYLTMEVLEKNFAEFMELDFTARMDDALDQIAGGERASSQYLREFFVGADERPGLKGIVDARKPDIPYPAFQLGTHPESSEPILIRAGKEGGAFLQVGDASKKQFANVPEDLAPADLTLEKALELLQKKDQPAESIGEHPATGRKLLLKNRQGYYLEVERTSEEIEAKVKPTWISLPPNVDPRTLSEEDLAYLCSLPHEIGKHPESGTPIWFKIGKFGAYLECGTERRTAEDWRGGARLTTEEAAHLLSQPKTGARSASSQPIQSFGVLEEGRGEVRVLAGRYGPYVTDGETNATLPKTVAPEALTAEEAIELLQKKREAGPSKKFTRRKKTKAPSRKKSA